MRQENRENDLIRAFLDGLAEIIADRLIDRLGPEIEKLVPQQNYLTARPTDTSSAAPLTVPHRSLWSIKEIAGDSGIKEATWRKWAYQRKIPIVRLGKSVRIRDVDYKRLIQKSFTPEVDLRGEMSRFT